MPDEFTKETRLPKIIPRIQDQPDPGCGIQNKLVLGKTQSRFVAQQTGDFCLWIQKDVHGNILHPVPKVVYLSMEFHALLPWLLYSLWEYKSDESLLKLH